MGYFLRVNDVFSICPGCGLKLEQGNGLDKNFNASTACLQLYRELSAFTLSLRDKDFPHQLAVDSYAAQHYGPNMKRITITFALIGLCLTFEHNFTGREVQLAHVSLGKKRRDWPEFNNRVNSGSVTVLDVLRNVTNENYNELLRNWGRAIWESWNPEQSRVEALITKYLNIQ